MILPNTESPPFNMDQGSVIGIPSPHALYSRKIPGVHLGQNHQIQPGCAIFANVFIGRDFTCGERVLIRDQVAIGDNVTLGSGVCIGSKVCVESRVTIGNNVTIPSGTIIHEGVHIGSNTRFIQEHLTCLNSHTIRPVLLKDNCRIGANCGILAGITIGEKSRIADGTWVSQDVPSNIYATGNPMQFLSMTD